MDKKILVIVAITFFLILVFIFWSNKNSLSDLDYNDSIPFIKPDGTEYFSKDVERTEQLTCDKYIDKDDVILELGSRYGTLSCLLAKKAKFLVTLDPDLEAIETCKKNMERHNVSFEALHGIISKQSQKIILTDYPDGYGKYTEFGESDIPFFNIKQIEEKYDIKFNTLVADCEGCLEQVLNENDISNINKILFETDRADACNYDNVYSILNKNGFKKQNDDTFYQSWSK